MSNLYLLNIPQAKINQLKKKGLDTLEDVSTYLPKKYIDNRTPKLFCELEDGKNAIIIGKVKEIRPNYSKNYVKVTVIDEKKNQMDLLWFGDVDIERRLIYDKKYAFWGVVKRNEYMGTLQMINPTFSSDINSSLKILPVYSKVPGMAEKYLEKCIKNACELVDKEDYLEESVLQDFSVVNFREYIRCMHRPKNSSDIKNVGRRYIFDELFKLAFVLGYENRGKKAITTVSCPKNETLQPFLDSLPFDLTKGEGGQKEVIDAIFNKLNGTTVSRSLVQGDVGCGKTVIAIACMLLMAENGYQSVLMAPTNVLALQHYEEVCKFLRGFDFCKPALLTGKLKAAEKKSVLKKIEDGEVNIIIGTHAVITDNIKFNNLGLNIVDEEHRFGVKQRKTIDEKKGGSVHCISMSATPIPRSLGVSLYGDGIDIYSITKMPKGRLKTRTVIESNKKKIYAFIKKQVEKGRQAYVVCPLITESKSERLEDVLSVEEVHAEMKKYFSKEKNIKIGIITGKMKKAQVEEKINAFKENKINIMVATTIVEVGVNVPNSTVMLVQNAERFGLAQLHQLRGRVGRGDAQAYCVLSTPKENIERLNILTKTTNGFEIAEEDIKIRGMGDFIGTAQSGMYKSVMFMIKFPSLFLKIKTSVKEILDTKYRIQRYLFLLDKTC